MNHRQSVDAQKHRKESAIFCDADYEAQIITFAAHLCHCGFDRVLAGFVRFRGLKVYVHDRALNQACAAARDGCGPPIGVWCGPRTTNHAHRNENRLQQTSGRVVRCSWTAPHTDRWPPCVSRSRASVAEPETELNNITQRRGRIAAAFFVLCCWP